jgi:hypothetical protein
MSRTVITQQLPSSYVVLHIFCKKPKFLGTKASIRSCGLAGQPKAAQLLCKRSGQGVLRAPFGTLILAQLLVSRQDLLGVL